MSLPEQIQQVESNIKEIDSVLRITSRIISEMLMKQGAAPPIDGEKIRKFLLTAVNLAEVGEEETARELLDQALESIESARQWLSVTDFGISAFILRTFMERNPITVEEKETLIRYYLSKLPHAHNDRDKLDYLLLDYFSDLLEVTDEPKPGLLLDIEDLLEPLVPALSLPEPSENIEKKLNDLYSLRYRLSEFTEFDKLVQARLVDKARAIKIQLNESYYHPSVLPRVIHFNLDFRQRFDALLQKQSEEVRRSTHTRIEEAWEILRSIEDVYERMELPGLARDEIEPALADTDDAESAPGAEPENERAPVDRLRRDDLELRKDADLQAVIEKISQFVRAQPVDSEKEDLLVPLNKAQLKLIAEERAAFLSGPENLPVSISSLQMGLGLVAWMEDERAAYREKQRDRYLWKPHFDVLSLAAARSTELLHVIRSIIHEEAPQEEAVWFSTLIRVALRMGTSLNHILPVFAPELEREPVS